MGRLALERDQDPGAEDRLQVRATVAGTVASGGFQLTLFVEDMYGIVVEEIDAFRATWPEDGAAVGR